MLRKVISGGQTGADSAGLVAAKAAGLATGGWMPRGFRALDGVHPEFSDIYGMKETEETAYPPRTAMNVRNSDATICIARHFDSPGELLTARFCRENKKIRIVVSASGPTEGSPVYPIKIRAAAGLIRTHGVEVLNVAGNSESTAPGIYDWSIKFLADLFEELKKTA